MKKLMVGVAFALAIAPQNATAARPTNVVAVKKSVTPDGIGTIVHEVHVKASPAEIWPVVSTADGWRKWSVPNAWTDERNRSILETATGPAGIRGGTENVKHRILASTQGRLLVFKTVQVPASFPAKNALVDVVWILELIPARGNGTTVRLTGTGFGGDRVAQDVLSFFESNNRADLKQLADVFTVGPVRWKKP